MNIVFEKLDRLRKLRLDIETMQSEVATLHDYIKRNCKHPEFAWVSKQKYTPGDYFDKAQTTTWQQCSICGAERNEHTEYGGYA